MTLTELASILGMIFGTGGLVIGILNYLRDKPKVMVRLSWGNRIANSPVHDDSKLWGLVTVTNSGRRPIYITSVSISLPKEFSGSQLLLLDSIEGRKLGEGDAPATFLLDQGNLTSEYVPHWKKMCAVVYDSSGKKYFSDPVKEQPSWAKHN
jgi:hypothetical protein